MSRFFDLLDDRRSLTRWHLGHPVDDRGEQIEPWQFEEGRRLELGCVPCFPLQVRGEPLDYCWATFSIPVVSPRVVQIFERLHIRDVQFIPARVEGPAEPYFILNALRIIRCIDDARCAEVQYWKPEDKRPDKEGQYRAVYRMRIDPTQVGDAHIFRPWGWTVALIVSEEIKQALEQAAITGARFVEV